MLRKVASNVFCHTDDIAVLDTEYLEFIKKKAKESPLQRARINFHNSDNQLLHEMIIAMTNKTVVEPHRHPGKSESFHIIEGIIRIGFTDDDGLLEKIVELGKDRRFYRMNSPKWHMVVPMTEIVTIHETTNGPFIRGKSSVFPTWDATVVDILRQTIKHADPDDRL